MTLTNFIKTRKDDIDREIRHRVPNAKINDRERRLWILNNETLYRLAKMEGVKI